MAVPERLQQIRVWLQNSFLAELLLHIQKNDLTVRAGSLALFAVMSVFPFIALLVWVSTLSGSIDEANRLVERLAVFLPHDIENLVRSEVSHRIDQEIDKDAFSVTFHVLLFVFSTGTAVRSFLFSLRQIARADETVGFLQIILRSFLFVIPTVVFAFVASLLVGIVSAISHILSASIGSNWISQPLVWLAMTCVLMLVLNATYASSFVGHQTIRIHGWYGSACGAVLVSTVSMGMSLYFEASSEAMQNYGSTGFIINVLLWFYACSLCVLLGAQINAVLEIRRRRIRALQGRLSRGE